MGKGVVDCRSEPCRDVFLCKFAVRSESDSMSTEAQVSYCYILQQPSVGARDRCFSSTCAPPTPPPLSLLKKIIHCTNDMKTIIRRVTTYSAMNCLENTS